jgi:hypothetical protein
MFVRRATQFFTATSGNGPVAAAELARALSGGGPTAVFRGPASIEPAPARGEPSALAEGRNGRASKWLHRVPKTPARSGHAGGLYNVDVPRGSLRSPPLTAGGLLDVLREQQALTVEGPATLGDTCVRNLRGLRSSFDSVATDFLDVGPGGLRVAGPTQLGKGLSVQGETTLQGGFLVEGSTTLEGDVITAGSVSHTGPTFYSGPTIFQGPVVLPGPDGEPVELELVPIPVVTNVYWDGSKLQKSLRIVYVSRAEDGGDEEIIDSTTCEAE